MDSCVEQGERAMFYIQKQCSRRKSLLASCTLNGGDCSDKLQALVDCTRDAQRTYASHT